MNRSEINGLQLRRIMRLEAVWRGRITSVIKAEFMAIAATLKAKGIIAARSQAAGIIMLDSIAEVLRAMYVAIGIMSANVTTRQITTTERKGFGKDEQWTLAILNYFRLFLLNKAVLPISAETREAILRILNKGIDEGWSIDKMAFELENSNFPLYRARMIVRTEIAKAQFYGRQLAEQDSEYELTKTWIAADDARTRPSHHKIDDKRIPYDAKFAVDMYRGRRKVGVELMDGPGDPNASAGNVINCRCILSVRAARDKNGRLIPKQRSNSNISVILPGRFVRPEPVITI